MGLCVLINSLRVPFTPVMHMCACNKGSLIYPARINLTAQCLRKSTVLVIAINRSKPKPTAVTLRSELGENLTHEAH